MSEDSNIVLAHKLAEASVDSDNDSRHWIIEILEAAGLSIVAIVTAWCGYNAARWDGRQSLLYGTATRLRVEAALAGTEGGQERLLDVVTFNTWIRLQETKNEKVAAFYVRRFSPEYRIAFDAWLKTDPFNNSNAPTGPANMPEYHNHNLIRFAELTRQADEAFVQGTLARDNAEMYVRGTVLLATILFLIALAQRFKVHIVRVSLLVVAAVMMVYALSNVAHYPRL
jgi:hypothetical protein